MTIEEFIAARLAEDEEAAQAAGVRAREWRASGYRVDGGPFEPPEFPDDDPPWMGSDLIVPDVFPSVGTHIARHDPARVLRQALALRAVVELIEGMVSASQQAEAEADVLYPLAEIWDRHPDYRQEWSLHTS